MGKKLTQLYNRIKTLSYVEMLNERNSSEADVKIACKAKHLAYERVLREVESLKKKNKTDNVNSFDVNDVGC